jgi:hypothetical protein
MLVIYETFFILSVFVRIGSGRFARRMRAQFQEKVPAISAYIVCL